MIDTFIIIGICALIIIGTSLLSLKFAPPHKVAHYRRILKEWQNLKRKAIETGKEKYLIKYKRQEEKMMKIQQKLARMQTPPLCISVTLIFVLFLFLNSYYSGKFVAVVPVDISIGGLLSFLGRYNGVSELPGLAVYFPIWYFLVSLALSPIRKILGVAR